MDTMGSLHEQGHDCEENGRMLNDAFVAFVDSARTLLEASRPMLPPEQMQRFERELHDALRFVRAVSARRERLYAMLSGKDSESVGMPDREGFVHDEIEEQGGARLRSSPVPYRRNRRHRPSVRRSGRHPRVRPLFPSGSRLGRRSSRL